MINTAKYTLNTGDIQIISYQDNWIGDYLYAMARPAENSLKVYRTQDQYYKEFPKGVIYESSTSGTKQLTLYPGDYDIVLIGGGGGAAAGYSQIRGAATCHNGGVGGTLQLVIKTTKTYLLTAQVGGGGITRRTTSSSSAANSAIGDDGQESFISGIPNCIMSAGGGTGGKNYYGDDKINEVGKMGTNTFSGSEITKVVLNNPQNIVSRAYPEREVIYDELYTTPNTNWPADTNRGAGGKYGKLGIDPTSSTIQNGMSGYCRITRI